MEHEYTMLEQELINWYHNLLGQQSLLTESANSFPFRNAAWGESKQVDEAVARLELLLGVKK